MWAKLKQMQPFGALAWGRFPLLPPPPRVCHENIQQEKICLYLSYLIKMVIISRSCVPILLCFVFPLFGNLEAVVETCVGAAAAHPQGASSWWTSRSQDACGVEHFHACMPRKDLSNSKNPRAGPSSCWGTPLLCRGQRRTDTSGMFVSSPLFVRFSVTWFPSVWVLLVALLFSTCS